VSLQRESLPPKIVAIAENELSIRCLTAVVHFATSHVEPIGDVGIGYSHPSTIVTLSSKVARFEQPTAKTRKTKMIDAIGNIAFRF
jgi:hypothetical protein